CLLVLLFIFPTVLQAQGLEIQNFTLKSTDGKWVSLSDYPDAKGFIVVFTCNHCPFAKLYPERLNALTTKYQAQGIPLLAISSMDTISYEEDTYLKMVRRAKKEGYNFPYLYDPDQAIAKLFGAEKTPQAFVLWKQKDHFEVNYTGAIDDNGMNPKLVEKPYVQWAVDALLKQQEVSITKTSAVGCQIYFRN
ncbi:MAG: thioredoxin family protein, partial [Flavobacteriia bacterium]|nr:thioredoxin family protein [Flavobacteriia bacterium]